VRPRAIKDLSQLSDAELFSELSKGLRLFVGNAIRLWRDARKLLAADRAQGFEILRLFTEEEAAKSTFCWTQFGAHASRQNGFLGNLATSTSIWRRASTRSTTASLV